METRLSLFAALLAGVTVSGCEAAKTLASAPLVVVGTTAMAISAANTTGFSFSPNTYQGTSLPPDPSTAALVGMSRGQLLARFGDPATGKSRADNSVTWKSVDCLIYANLAKQDGEMRATSVRSLPLKDGLSREACVAAMSSGG